MLLNSGTRGLNRETAEDNDDKGNLKKVVIFSVSLTRMDQSETTSGSVEVHCFLLLNLLKDSHFPCSGERVLVIKYSNL